MNPIDFLSEGIYTILPSSNQPRVYLAINSKKNAELSFHLYNPFSKKAKLLKFLASFIYTYFNTLSKIILPTIRVTNSVFIDFLNQKFDTEIISSLYVATANDKYVIQLKNDTCIIGYLKFPLNNRGKERLLNEENAILTLSKKGILPKFILKDSFNGTVFLILKNLEGTIGNITQNEYRIILNLFMKDNKFILNEHPRVIKIQKELSNLGLNQLLNILQNLIKNSSTSYFEVFEHGDFAPWNLMKTNEGIVPFDFEYFEEKGLEYLDEFKYHFQLERLVHGKKGRALIEILSKTLLIKEFNLIFIIFLMKEIVIKHKEKLSYDFEISLINILQNE